MTYAPNYSKTVDFATEETNAVAGRSTVRTTALDTELANIASSINALNTNLKKLQRDDGKITDLLIEPFMLSEQSRALISTGGNPRGDWVAITIYSLKDIVQHSGFAYICHTPHTSTGMFDPTKWIAISGDGSSAASAAAAALSELSASNSAAAALANKNATDTNVTTTITKANEALNSANSSSNSAAAAQTNKNATDANVTSSSNYASIAIAKAAEAAASAASVSQPASTNEFRLSLSNGVPVTSIDVTGATSIYAVPHGGNGISLYSGTAWIIRRSPGFSVALGVLINGATYDIFCYDNSGVPAIELSAAWNSSTTRFASGPYATLLPTQDGIPVKSTNGTNIDNTRRYLGSFTTTSAMTTEDSAKTRYLYNYYHKCLRPIINSFTADRARTSNVYVEIDSEIRCKFLVGTPVNAISVAANGSSVSGASGFVGTNISLDGGAVSVSPGLQSIITTGGPSYVVPINIAGNIGGGQLLAIGPHYLTLMGKGDGVGTCVWAGIDTASKNTCYIHANIYA